MPKRIVRSLLVVASAGGLALAAAPTASANSFTERVLGGTYSYNDGQDRFCVDTRGASGLRINVNLYPHGNMQGRPNYRFTVGPNQRTCRSLARAYEDTYYVATIDARRGVNGSYESKHFYS